MVKYLLLFLCIPILYFCPVLYPPIASFASIFFMNGKDVDFIALFLLFSAATITSFIAATIIPVSDTIVYINSFQSIQLFDFSELSLSNDGLEPFYKLYEYGLSLFIGDNPNLFLLASGLITNGIITIAILRICDRLDQLKLVGIIFTVYYSLVAPLLGAPLFLLRSNLSLSILLLAISFYNEVPILFYLFGIVSVFLHYSSLLVFGVLILLSCSSYCVKNIAVLNNPGFSRFLTGVGRKVSLLLLLIGFTLVTTSPSLITSALQDSLSSFGDIGNAASGKAKSFLDAGEEKFIDLQNPVFLIHAMITLLCFLKLQENSWVQSGVSQKDFFKRLHFLESLRIIGRTLLIIIVSTSPLNVFPYRIGFFNFLFFSLWLINIPFLSLKPLKKLAKYLIPFALVTVFAYTFYWMPKREGVEYFIVVLEGKPLRYTLPQVIEQFLK